MSGAEVVPCDHTQKAATLNPWSTHRCHNIPQHNQKLVSHPLQPPFTSGLLFLAVRCPKCPPQLAPSGGGGLMTKHACV